MDECFGNSSMKRVKRGAWKRWFAAAAALSWTAFGLVWAQVILLPNPVLPPQLFAELLGDVPPSTHPQRFVVMILKETSLLLPDCALHLPYAARGRGGEALALDVLARPYCLPHRRSFASAGVYPATQGDAAH
jgi:hypothetical protein